MLACLALVHGFRSSRRLAAAYGLAVSGTMAITTLLFIAVARRRWKWSMTRVAVIAGVFLVTDLAFLAANLLKIRDGGWIPLAIGAAAFILLSTWRRGRVLLQLAAQDSAGGADQVQAVIASVRRGSCMLVAGTAAYVHRGAEGVPPAFPPNTKHNKVATAPQCFLPPL